LTEFKINFYDLLLVDVNMPEMNGFEFSEKILELDLNVRICYISAGEMNIRISPGINVLDIVLSKYSLYGRNNVQEMRRH
jgi:two-component SAPR family response regulator